MLQPRDSHIGILGTGFSALIDFLIEGVVIVQDVGFLMQLGAGHQSIKHGRISQIPMLCLYAVTLSLVSIFH